MVSKAKWGQTVSITSEINTTTLNKLIRTLSGQQVGCFIQLWTQPPLVQIVNNCLLPSDAYTAYCHLTKTNRNIRENIKHNWGRETFLWIGNVPFSQMQLKLTLIKQASKAWFVLHEHCVQKQHQTRLKRTHVERVSQRSTANMIIFKCSANAVIFLQGSGWRGSCSEVQTTKNSTGIFWKKKEKKRRNVSTW